MMVATSEQMAGRLRTGEQMIEAETDPEKRETLTDFWLELLRQYEAAIDVERERDERQVAS